MHYHTIFLRNIHHCVKNLAPVFLGFRSHFAHFLKACAMAKPSCSHKGISGIYRYFKKPRLLMFFIPKGIPGLRILDIFLKYFLRNILGIAYILRSGKRNPVNRIRIFLDQRLR
jgi:hypothetical protein